MTAMSEARRLLIVDDEQDFAETVSLIAARLGYAVRTVDSRRTFEAAAVELQPTVVVVDMVMPDFDGNEALAWLADRAFAGRIVIITGFDQAQAEIAARLARVRGLEDISCLSKPVRPDQIRDVLA